MRTREKILMDLVYLNEDVAKLQAELSSYSWDIDNPVFTVTSAVLYNVLSKFNNENVSFNLIEEWANAIECREDLDFENETLREIINELANPTLFGQLNAQRLRELIEKIEI